MSWTGGSGDLGKRGSMLRNGIPLSIGWEVGLT